MTTPEQSEDLRRMLEASTAYEARWIWWLTEATVLLAGKIDVAHARAAFEATALDPYRAQITPQEYAGEVKWK
jgi:hypothetical protein